MTDFCTNSVCQSSAEPALLDNHPRALRKSEYQDRSKNGKGAMVRPRNISGLPDCPDCNGTSRNASSRSEYPCHCFNGFIVTPELARQATSFRRGTPEKVAILAARNELGFRWDGSLNHPCDAADEMEFWDALLEPEDDDFGDGIEEE